MDNYLVIGASGQVGSCVMTSLTSRGLNAIGTCFSRYREPLITLSLDDPNNIGIVISNLKPKIIFLCAALTHVDKCESEPELFYKINVKGTDAVGRAAEKLGSKFVFISTDYVFNGKAGPYIETDGTSPLSTYGKQKVITEDLVLSHVPESIVARTTWVFSQEKPGPGKNFAQRLVSSLSKHEEVRVPIDQFGTPTYAPDLAENLVDLALHGASGIIHLAGRSYLSRFEFAHYIADRFSLEYGLVKGVKTSELGQAAVRPLKAGLRSIRTNLLPDLQYGLDRMFEEAQSG